MREPYTPRPYVQMRHPEWSRRATLYEVNLRQYTPEGTFRAFREHLPRLAALGVDILWLMPIHPIGEDGRKGSLGSFYAVRDYFAVSPELGDLDDFRGLVEAIHAAGMRVILDWVANHTARDNALTREHPEWYTKTRDGQFRSTPWYDWDDIIELDYDQPGLRRYMTEALKYWVRELDIDGYRCDVAGFVPLDFWEQARAELEAIKPVFLLAEWESRDLHARAFDASYAWSLWDRLKAACDSRRGLQGLREYLAHDVGSFPRDAYRVVFTTNHDKNAWEGTAPENFGPGLEAALVFCGVVRGMPLIYSGQEAGLDRALPFYEKDAITWRAHPHAELIRRLFALKHANAALENGGAAAVLPLEHDRPEQVLAFAREAGEDRVLALFNFSAEVAAPRLQFRPYDGAYRDLFTGENRVLEGAEELRLEPWSYRVFFRGSQDPLGV